MEKWYENDSVDSSAIISSRIRLARNLKKYHFYSKLDEDESKEMINDIVSVIKSNNSSIKDEYDFVDINSKTDIEKIAMLEKHEVSIGLLKRKGNKAILVNKDESLNIMLNEEDHIRIQSICPGKDIIKAWEVANNMDNFIEETVEYAYSKEYGYLTSCPSNTGTGLRASYMVHLPMLELSGKLAAILKIIGKFGMTIRGIYGEGSNSIGSIYQISNQTTLGKTEEEIISNLDNITSQIINSESNLMYNNIKQNHIYFKDKVYRAYGILANCRQISMSEAVDLLSTLRIGFLSDILKIPRPKKTIYNMIMNIEQGNLQRNLGKKLLESEIEIARADYIRSVLSN